MISEYSKQTNTMHKRAFLSLYMKYRKILIRAVQLLIKIFGQKLYHTQYGRREVHNIQIERSIFPTVS